jgi:hypothetical protein
VIRKTVQLDQIFYALTPRLADASGWVSAPASVPASVPNLRWTDLTNDLADQLEELHEGVLTSYSG